MNLTALLSTQIERRLTLEELLKVRPHFWSELALEDGNSRHIKQTHKITQRKKSNTNQCAIGFLKQSWRVLQGSG